MATHAIRLHGAQAPSAARSVKWRTALQSVAAHYLLLPAGALAAIVWANTAPDSYFTIAHALAFPVNEIAMVLFFGLIAQEIVEEVMPGGALHRWRQWIVPIVAAVGGAAGSAFVYGAFVYWRIEPLLHAGWPAVVGVDIAFAYFIARAIFRHQPAVPFVLLLAAASNVIAVAAIAPTFVGGGGRATGGAVLMAAAIGLAAWMRRQRVHQFWPYLWIAGGLSWLALYVEGFHPALALVPIVPFMPHVRRRLDQFLADEDDRRATARHFEHIWQWHVHVALLLFGLVNAGVVLSGYGNGSWATVLGALAGRTVGVMAAVGLAAWMGLRLPAHVRARELFVIALTVSAGFTFTLFFATTLYAPGPLLAELKIGALMTAVGLALALAAAWLLHVGRFARQHRRAAGGVRRPLFRRQVSAGRGSPTTASCLAGSARIDDAPPATVS